MQTSKRTAPHWMRRVLLAAGLYNGLWGTFAVMFPSAVFRWLEMSQPNYPQFWQCIGMIVGVYGLGYAIAAFDPARHWPIVLVGLLGKILGPLGMLQALWTGELPRGFALICLTNDLIWWVPFTLILKYAWDQFREDSGWETLPDLSTLLHESRTSTGENLDEMSQRRPVLVVFLRHSGCTFCREALADLFNQRAAIEAQGVQLALVHMGTPTSFSGFAGEYGLADVAAVADPERRLYRGMGLRRGNLSQLLGWAVWWRGAKSFFSGHRAGLLEGDATQMPGAFLLQEGRVVRSFLHRTAADRPDYVELSRLTASK